MRLVLELHEIGADDAERVGGKVLALANLHRAGLTVPPTLCLTTDAYRLFVDRGSLSPVIHQELGRKRFDDMRWEEIWDAALRIRNRFLRTPVPEEITTALRERLSATWLEHPLVVRSSALGEDAPNASFAGLHDSFVGVRGLDGLLEAIRGVWASLWTDRALLYRRELGLDPDASVMAVAVQRLVEGEVSGIAFGVHPTDTDLAVVEAVYGLNEGLVDGTIAPDRWILERATGRITEHVPPQERRRLVVRGPETIAEPVSEDRRERPPLDDGHVADVAATARACERLFGSPQDMEWTVDNDHLVVLQSRPVTTSTETDDDPRSWYLSLTRSLGSLQRLSRRVDDELLPAMDHEASEIAARDLASLGAEALADEIERRRAAHDRWVDVYWQEFIPLAHGIRLFGQFYNQVVKPEDPYEFMEALADTPILAVRRNQSLDELAAMIRGNTALRERLAEGDVGGAEFERRLEGFVAEFGDAVFVDRLVFRERSRLIRLLLAMAEAPISAEVSASVGAEQRAESFVQRVEPARRGLARELLALGRSSYRLRDDDNLHLGRLEGLVLAAVEEGRQRLHDHHGVGVSSTAPDAVVRALRHPNLLVEPSRPASQPEADAGFRTRPRQLVGQPAGPGVANGSARVVESAEDLFDLQAGEILVCDAVDPNMTFVVPLAAAVVERRGGMLIHGAIIAREYGRPCVTGVADVTAAIATGDRLTVDGYLGIVTVT